MKVKKTGDGVSAERRQTRRKSLDKNQKFASGSGGDVLGGGTDVLSMALAAPGFGGPDGSGGSGVVKSLFPAMAAGEAELCAILMSRAAQRSLVRRIDEASEGRARAMAAEADAAMQRATDLEASFQRKSQNSNALFETFQRELQVRRHRHFL